MAAAEPKVPGERDDRTWAREPTSDDDRGMRHDNSWDRALIALQSALATSAAFGSVGLSLQLHGFEMPTSWLRPLPLDSWVLPGIALLALVGLPLGAAAVAGFRHDRRRAVLSWCAAGLLVGWLVVQVAVIGIRAPVQVVTLGLALLLIGLTVQSTGAHR